MARICKNLRIKKPRATTNFLVHHAIVAYLRNISVYLACKVDAINKKCRAAAKFFFVHHEKLAYLRNINLYFGCKVTKVGGMDKKRRAASNFVGTPRLIFPF